MGPLTAAGLCALMVSGQPSGQTCEPVRHISSPLIDRRQLEISEASRRFGIPEEWIRGVMHQESAGLTALNGQPITSRAGAMGLMQLMPETWSDMRVRYVLGDNPHDPHDNILAGTAYLRALYDHYGYPNLFAAYQAGPARLEAYLADEKPLPDATLAYLKALVPGIELPPLSVKTSTAKVAKSNSNSLFFVLLDGENSPSKGSVLDSKSLKSGQENQPKQFDDTVRSDARLFVPLTNPAR